MRFLACALLVIATTYGTEAKTIVNTDDICVPNEAFSYYCVTCICGDDGLVDNALCPFMNCDFEEWNRDGTRKSSDEEDVKSEVETASENRERCIPGESFPYYCNTCSCGEDGLVDNAACTWMRCYADEWNKDGTRKPLEENNSDSEVNKGDETKEAEDRCVPGESFPYYCNTCFCGEDGLVDNAACTWMRCDADEWNKDGTRKPLEENNSNSEVNKGEETKEAEDRCVPGESFPYYCNTCSCGDDGLVENAVCPFMLCDEEDWYRNGTRKPAEEEISAETVPIVKVEETCVPYTGFKDYCNDCTCQGDGLKANAHCTRMSCSHDEWNQDGTRKYPEEEEWSSEKERQGSDESCTPHGMFNYYCNSCICGADGKVANARCTQAECDRFEWNKDGSERPFSLDPSSFD